MSNKQFEFLKKFIKKIKITPTMKTTLIIIRGNKLLISPPFGSKVQYGFCGGSH